MIDSYATVAIVLRAFAAIGFVIVLYKQIKLLRPITSLQYLKHLLVLLTGTMLFNAILSIYTNVYRQDDGNLIPNARHVSLIFNAVSGLCAAIILLIIYKEDE